MSLSKRRLIPSAGHIFISFYLYTLEKTFKSFVCSPQHMSQKKILISVHGKRKKKTCLTSTMKNGSRGSQIKWEISSHLLSSGLQAYPAGRAVSLCEGGRYTTHSPTLAVMKSVMNVCVLILFY